HLVLALGVGLQGLGLGGGHVGTRWGKPGHSSAGAGRGVSRRRFLPLRRKVGMGERANRGVGGWSLGVGGGWGRAARGRIAPPSSPTPARPARRGALGVRMACTAMPCRQALLTPASGGGSKAGRPTAQPAAASPSGAATTASVVIRMWTSSLTAGAIVSTPKSLRLVVVVASKPAAARLSIGCSAKRFMVTSSTTGWVLSLMVRSPVTLSWLGPAASTAVLRKVAAGKRSASKKSALSRWVSKSGTNEFSPDSGRVTSTDEADTLSASN